MSLLLLHVNIQLSPRKKKIEIKEKEMICHNDYIDLSVRKSLTA